MLPFSKGLRPPRHPHGSAPSELISTCIAIVFDVGHVHANWSYQNRPQVRHHSRDVVNLEMLKKITNVLMSNVVVKWSEALSSRAQVPEIE